MHKKIMLASVLLFVTPALADDLGKELSKYVSSYPQVRLTQIGPVYVLDGTVDEKRDHLELNAVAEGLKEKGVGVRYLVTLSPKGKEAMAASIEKRINSPEIVVYFVGEDVFLEGTADTDFEADRAVEIAKAHTADNIVRRPAQMDQSKSGVVDLLRVRPAAPSMLLPKTKKLSKAP